MKPNFIQAIQKSRALKTVICCLLCLTLLFNVPFSRPASAAEVGEVIVAIEAAEEILEVLRYLGLTDARLEDPTTWAISKQWSYIKQFLEAQGNSPQDWIEAIATKIVKKGDNYYIADTNTELVSPSQLGFYASKMPDDWGFAVNFTGAVISDAYYYFSPTAHPDWYQVLTNVSVFIRSNELRWLTPFVETTDGLFVCQKSFTLPATPNSQEYINYYSDDVPSIHNTYKGLAGLSNVTDARAIYMYFNQGATYVSGHVSSGKFVIEIGLGGNSNVYGMPSFGTFRDVNRDFYIYNEGSVNSNTLDTLGEFPNGANGQTILRRGYLVSSQIPTFDLDFDASKIGDDIIVSPGGSAYNPGDSEGYPLVPPSDWSTYGTPLQYQQNSGTTFNQYVKDGYIINNNGGSPSGGGNFILDGSIAIDADVNLSGGLNIDISINDKTELPSISEGDGSAFFNANVVDALAALTTQNPIMVVLEGIFAAIDPVLLGIFSTAVSLLIVLGIWKLVRG